MVSSGAVAVADIAKAIAGQPGGGQVFGFGGAA